MSETKKVGLILYAVYKNPLDYPGKFVVRKWVGLFPDEAPVIVADSLEAARLSIPGNLYRLDRMIDDDPAILETWI